MRIPLYSFLILELLIISYYDYRTKKISNLWPILNMVFGIGVFIFLSEEYPLKGRHFLIPGLAFGIGFLFYQFKKIGAGDTKLVFSLLLLIPNELQLKYIYGLCIAIILVGVPVLGYNLFQYYRDKPFSLKTIKWNDFRAQSGKKFTFGPVVLLGWLIFGYENIF